MSTIEQSAEASAGAAAEARAIGLRLWDALPAFLVSGVAVCVATGFVLWFAPGFSPITLLLLAVLPGPLHAALVAQAAAAIDGDAPGVFSLLAVVRATIRAALTLLVPPAVTGALALVALLAAARSGSWLPLVPAGVAATCTVLLLVAALFGLPLAALEPALRGARLTLAALHVAARRPIPLLGALAVVVIACWACAQFSGTLLFLLPAPLAAVSVLAARAPVCGER